MMNSMPVVSSGCCTKAELVLGGGALPVRFSTAAGVLVVDCALEIVFVEVSFAVFALIALVGSSVQRVRSFGVPDKSRAEAELADGVVRLEAV